MGKIPEYSRSSFQSSAGVADDGQAIARGVQDLGAAIFDVGLRHKQAQDASFVSSKAIDLESEAAQIELDFQKENESSPLGKEKLLQERLKSRIDEVASTAPSSSSQESLKRMGDNLMRNYSERAVRWGNEQNVKNIGSEINRSSETLQSEAFRFADPAKIGDLFKQHDTLLVPAALALSSQAVDNIRNVGRREIVSSAVEGMIQKERLGAAKKLLDSKQYDAVLGADKTKRAYEMIDAKAEAIRNRKEKILELRLSDPWKFLSVMGESPKNVTLVSQDPTAITNSFQAREQFVTDMSKKYGIQLPFVSPLEAKVFINQFMQGNAKDAASVMNSFDQKVTDRQRMLFAREVFEQEPGLGVAFMAAAKAQDVAAAIIEGQGLLRNGKGGKAVNAPSEGKVAEAYDAVVGEAIQDSSFRVATKQAAVAYLVKKKLDRGEADLKDINSSDFKESFEKIVGPIAHINGTRTLSFRGKSGKFLDEDQLADLVDSLNDKEIQKAQGAMPLTKSGEPMRIEKRRGRFGLKATGDGSYWIVSGEDFAMDAKGQPFELNLKAIEAARAPTREKDWIDYTANALDIE